MKRYFAMIFLLFGLVGCTGQSAPKVEEEEKPALFKVSDEDREEFHLAIQKALETLDEFKKKLESGETEGVTFTLKVLLEAPDGVNGEHIWVTDITTKDDEYYGVIDNVPVYTEEVKYGDKMKIKKENISDWMYVENGKLYGGYTLRLVRSRMTDEEREQFDAMTGLIIEE